MAIQSVFDVFDKNGNAVLSLLWDNEQIVRIRAWVRG